MTLLLIVLACFSPLSVSADSTNGEQEKVLVTFDGEIDYAWLDEVGAIVSSDLPSINAVIATIPTSAETFELTSTTSSDPIQFETIPDDDVFVIAEEQVNWGYTATSAQRALPLGYTGKGIKVGVMDSGINGRHPDLKVAGGISFQPTSHLIDPKNHGTHVAGIISALANSTGVRGVAPDISLYSIKSLDDRGFGNLETIAKGIQWAIDNELDILNMSFTNANDVKSDGEYPALRELMKAAEDAGILLVGAAGNGWSSASTKPTDVLYPARYSSVIAVSAVTNQLRIADFSYRGPSVELTAPGVEILSTTVNGSTTTQADYGYLSGTSMAAPFVSGIAAQYMQAYPHLTANQIRLALQRNAQDIGAAGKDTLYGHGLVQSLRTKVGVFPDTRPDMWYSQSLDYLFEANGIQGFPDGLFKPTNTLTREQAITLIGRALDYPTTNQSTYYSDVKSSSYALPYIAEATRLGHIQGTGNGKFSPELPMKRGDVAKIFQSIFSLEATQPLVFPDVNQNSYYAEAIQAGYEAGFITGYEDGTFKPEQTINRIEFVHLLAKALQEN